MLGQPLNMPLIAEYFCSLLRQKQIISQQTVEKMIYRGQRLHRLGKTGMNGVTRFLRIISQLPDTQQPQIVPENASAEPLPVMGWLCMVVGNIRLCWRSGIDAEILGKFFCGIFEADAEELAGEVNDITGGITSEAVETSIHFHAGIVILMERAFRHSTPVDRQPIPFGCLSGGYGLLDSFVG